MKKWLLVFIFILRWRASWFIQKWCPGYYDEVRGENRPESERLWCQTPVFNWRVKDFDTLTELEHFRDHDLNKSPGTVVTDISIIPPDETRVRTFIKYKEKKNGKM